MYRGISNTFIKGLQGYILVTRCHRLFSLIKISVGDLIKEMHLGLFCFFYLYQTKVFNRSTILIYLNFRLDIDYTHV